MGIGSINIGSTPCCGLISRNYDCSSDQNSETGWTHNPGGDYAPTLEDFRLEKFHLEIGICPDCNGHFEKWLHNFGHYNQDDRQWEWNFSEAQRFFNDTPKKRIENMRKAGISLPRILGIFREMGLPLRGKLLGQGLLRK